MHLSSAANSASLINEQRGGVQHALVHSHRAGTLGAGMRRNLARAFSAHALRSVETPAVVLELRVLERKLIRAVE